MAAGEGAFKPREVDTGARFGDRVRITSGLSERQNVVVLGMFLLDSESRMGLAAAPSKAPAKGANTDPVCGTPVDPAKSAHRTEREGKT